MGTIGGALPYDEDVSMIIPKTGGRLIISYE
jgi:hypothetical protein